MSEQTQTAAAQDTTNAVAPAVQTAVTEAPATASAQTPATQTTEAAQSQTPATQTTEVVLKAPEGTLLKQAEIDKIASYAKEKGLSNDQANELLMQRHEAVDEYVKDYVSEVDKIKEGWIDLAKKDTELGGDLFGQNIEIAKRAVERIATPELRQFFDESKMGNHPEVIRVFYRIGKMMAEDKMISSGANNGAPKKSHEEIFYGSKT